MEFPETAIASRWKMLLAKLFGVKHVWREDGWVMTLYKYKGVTYVASHEFEKQQTS